MSSSLCYRPLDNYTETLSDETKFLLRKRYGDPIDVILHESDIDYLVGLSDAMEESKDILKLLSAINKYANIELKECW